MRSRHTRTKLIVTKRFVTETTKESDRLSGSFEHIWTLRPKRKNLHFRKKLATKALKCAANQGRPEMRNSSDPSGGEPAVAIWRNFLRSNTHTEGLANGKCDLAKGEWLTAVD